MSRILIDSVTYREHLSKLETSDDVHLALKNRPTGVSGNIMLMGSDFLLLKKVEPKDTVAVVPFENIDFVELSEKKQS